MKYKKTRIDGCYIAEGERHYDKRGYFEELYSAKTQKDNTHWQQVNCSYSDSMVLRGLHEAPYQKLVTCLIGEIFDVVVDLRPDSKTYMRSIATWLTENEFKQVLIPAGCAHGFLATTRSLVTYLQDEVYQAGKERDWKYDSFDVKWPGRPGDFILSEKDKNAPTYERLT